MAETSLFRSRGARLFLIDGDEIVLMKSGDFAFLLVKHCRSPLAAVAAMVGDVQWPVGKDSAVTKVGEGSFSFSLPGPLMYGLVLANTTTAADQQKFERLLEEYSTYQAALVHSEAGTGVQQGQEKVAEQQAAEFWTKFARKVEGRIAASPAEELAEAAAAAAAAGGTAFQKKRSGEEVSPSMVKRMQQATRMSAVAKLFSKSLERGAINASTHIDMAVAGAGSPFSATDLAVASVDAVAKVVECVESAGRTSPESAGSAGANWVQRIYGQEARETGAEGLSAVGSFINSAWTLNKVGLRMLFRVIAASTAINSGGSSSSLSGSTSSSDHIRRLLSSSSSSSSFTSRSPVTPSYLQGAVDSSSRWQVTAPPPPPPPPPLFASSAVPFRNAMPPPPPVPPPSLSAAVAAADSPSPSFRLYKPRPAPAAPANPLPPFLPGLPPRPHPPSQHPHPN